MSQTTEALRAFAVEVGTNNRHAKVIMSLADSLDAEEKDASKALDKQAKYVEKLTKDASDLLKKIDKDAPALKTSSEYVTVKATAAAAEELLTEDPK